MRRRPFKFFFGLTIGIMAFFFLAKVFFIALIVAGVMSLTYHFFRGIKYSLMDFNPNREYAYRRFDNPRYDSEPTVDRTVFFDEYDTPYKARRERIIQVL